MPATSRGETPIFFRQFNKNRYIAKSSINNNVLKREKEKKRKKDCIKRLAIFMEYFWTISWMDGSKRCDNHNRNTYIDICCNTLTLLIHFAKNWRPHKTNLYKTFIKRGSPTHYSNTGIPVNCIHPIAFISCFIFIRTLPIHEH